MNRAVMNSKTVCLALLLALTVRPALARNFAAELRGADVVPPTQFSGSGNILAVLDSCPENPVDSITVAYAISQSGSGGVTGAHLCLGAAGTNGPTIASLVEGPFTFVADLLRISNEYCQALDRGEVYVVVETTAYPEGSIRGQLRPELVPTEPMSWGRIKSRWRPSQ